RIRGSPKSVCRQASRVLTVQIATLKTAGAQQHFERATRHHSIPEVDNGMWGSVRRTVSSETIVGPLKLTPLVDSELRECAFDRAFVRGNLGKLAVYLHR